MLYLVFGTLLILGAGIIGLTLYTSHKKNRILMSVTESRCEVEQEADSVRSIRVVHELEFELDGEKMKTETDLIPVREIQGAQLHVYYDRNSGSVYRPDFKLYISIIFAFVLCGICCLGLYILQEFSMLQVLTVEGAFVLLFSIIALVAFSHLDVLVNPAIIKTKGNYEGVMCPEGEENDVEVYSLWYGEHRQYTTRVKGMRVRSNAQSPVILFYNTKTGVAHRIHEMIISIIFGLAALTAVFVILFV